MFNGLFRSPVLFALVLLASKSLASATCFGAPPKLDERYSSSSQPFDIKLAVTDINQARDQALQARAHKAIRTMGPGFIPTILAYIEKTGTEMGDFPLHDFRADSLLNEFGVEGKPYLIEAMKSPKPLTRYTVISELGNIAFNDELIRTGKEKPIADIDFTWVHDSDIKPALIASCNDKNERVMLEAARVCTRLKFKEISKLAEAYFGDRKKDPIQRREILSVLVGLNNTSLETIEALGADLFREGAPDGFSTVISVTEYSTKLSLQLLTRLYGRHGSKSKNDVDFRYGTALALVRYEPDDLKPLLSKCLSDSNSKVRGQAIQTLGFADKEAALPQLITFAHSKDDEIAAGGIMGIASTGSPSAFDEIMKLTKDANKSRLLAIITAVGMLKDTRGLTFLKPYLNSKDDDLRSEAETSLMLVKKSIGEAKG